MAQLIFQHSLLWIVPVALAAVLSVWWLYKSASFTKGQKWLLGSLRFLLLLVLCFLLLEPSLKRNFTDEEKPLLLWLTDRSSSISAEAKALEEAAYAEAQNALGAQYELVRHPFANGLALGQEIDTQYTDIAQSLQQLQSNYYRQYIAGGVLWTDGIYNRSANPFFQSKTLGFPLYTVGLGDSTAYADIRIAGFNANEEAFLENEFALNVQLEANALAGKEARLRIVNAAGKEVYKKPITIKQAKQSFTAELFLTADKPGLQRYTASVTVFEEETNTRNNSSALSINITNKQKQVAILAGGPHPDIYALRAALAKTERFRTELFFNRVPGEQNLRDYDLLILHEASIEQYAAVTESKKNMWLFNGPNTNPQVFSTFGGARGRQFEPTQLYVNPDFSLFDIPAEMIDLSADAAPLLSPFGKLSMPQGAIALYNKQLGAVKTNEPIWYFHAQESKKIGVTQGVNLWRWRLDEYRQTGQIKGFDALIQSAVAYLSTAAAETRFTVTYKRNYRAGEAITLSATVLNAANALSDKAKVDIALEDEKGKRYTYSFSNQGKGYVLQLGGLDEGIYNFKATAQLGDERFEKLGSFEVKTIQVEQNDLAARFGLLRSMAVQSEGAFYFPTETSGLFAALQQSQLAIPKAVMRSETKPLLSYKLLFFILFTLAGLEWVLRKYFGKY